MKIFGIDMKKSEILKRIGDISQLGGLRFFEFTDGMSKGIRAVDIKSPSGIDMTVLIDRCMDISYFSYKSIPICWRSAVRETAPAYYESMGDEWLRTFFGGLLTTCGLTHIGPPSKLNNQEFGLHGRISNISANNVCYIGKWEDDSYKMSISGKIREAKLFGDYLELTRKITTYMDIPKIIIEDSVENIGYRISPLMILYHINIGFPILDKGSELLEGKAKVQPWGEESVKNFNSFKVFSEPIPNYKEQAFFHDIEKDKNGDSNIALVNPNFNKGNGIGVWIKFNKNNLPWLNQWKYLSEGEYVCGIEPANTTLRGRKIEQDKGNIKFIKQGEKLDYRIEINILKSNEDIENFKNNFCK